MNKKELYERLAMPEEVVEKLLKYDGQERKIPDKIFDVDMQDKEAMWFMDWVYPGYQAIDNKLPEKTTLQKRLKQYLLEGNKFGVAKGHINWNYVRQGKNWHGKKE